MNDPIFAGYLIAVLLAAWDTIRYERREKDAMTRAAEHWFEIVHSPLVGGVPE